MDPLEFRYLNVYREGDTTPNKANTSASKKKKRKNQKLTFL